MSEGKRDVHADPPGGGKAVVFSWAQRLRGHGCSHIAEIRDVMASGAGCDECAANGDDWAELRICRSCGAVLCSSGSKNHHAIRHYLATGHPIVQSFQPGETWMWCWPDELYLEPYPGEAGGGTASGGIASGGMADRRSFHRA